MARFIVITTIHAKTEAVLSYEKLPGWQLLIIGDRKTPPIESCDNTAYFSVDDQAESGLEVNDLLPYNHYCRKNIGYLLALGRDAESIFDTDDDNFPYDDWTVQRFSSQSVLRGSDRYINVYRHFTDCDIWPRGFPLDMIKAPGGTYHTLSEEVPVGVWQAMADDDPDVDAIYRLVNGAAVRFQPGDPVHLERGAYCPFNSQATAWTRKAFPFMYLPCTVSFRFTDILRGYVAQRLLWEQGLYLGFHKASVYQIRNAHDLMHDFSDEVEMYLKTRSVVDVLEGLQCSGDPFQDLYDAYQALCAAGIVPGEELPIVSAWIRDFQRISGNS